MLFATFFIPISVSADETVTTFKSLDDTTVEDDLKYLYIDLEEKFPLDQSDDQIYLIYFAEHGYSELSGIDSDIFGLYLYIYNPSGKALIGATDKVQFATQWTKDNKGNIKALNYSKYSMQLLSENENRTLAKFKVNRPDLKLMLKSNGTRRYDISGIELAEDAFNIQDYTVGTTYTFSGYAQGLSSESKDKSTLVCVCDSLLTVKVDAHQVSYLSGNSALGVGYSNQVNSVYFSLPQELIEEYGELYSIKYEYNHYYTSPIIVTDNYYSHAELLGRLGKTNSDIPFNFAISDSRIKTGSYITGDYRVYDWFYGKKFESIDDKYADSGLTPIYTNAKRLDYLTTVFLNTQFEDGWSEGDVLVTSDKLEEYFQSYNASYHTGKELGYSADLFDLTKSKKYEVFTKNINDEFSLAGYYDNPNNRWRLWLDYGFVDKDDYKGITDKKYIEQIDTVSVFNDSDFSKNYLVDEIYIDDFKSFYNSATANDENVYLLRYAIADDYFSNDNLRGQNIDGNFIMCQGNVYLNFDFIYFSFMDKKGNETIIPAVSNPTDGYFNVTDIDPDMDFGDLIIDIGGAIGDSVVNTVVGAGNFLAKLPETLSKFFNVLKIVLVVIAVITVIVLCFIFIPPLNNLIKGLFSGKKKKSKNKEKHKDSNTKPKAKKKSSFKFKKTNLSSKIKYKRLSSKRYYKKRYKKK